MYSELNNRYVGISTSLFPRPPLPSSFGHFNRKTVERGGLRTSYDYQS